VIEARGGTLTLGAAVTSGTIAIDSGMLEFGGGCSRFAGPDSLHGFTATLDFTGSTGALEFEGVTSISEMLKGNQLYVFESTYPDTPPTQIADFRLSGGNHSASSFSVLGNNTIQFARAAPV
jgi:hypothetical protein